LNLPIAVSNSVLGITPASESLLAFTITMNRIVVLRFDPFWAGYRRAGLHQQDERAFTPPTCQ
jgi:hypothetical protein